MVISVRSAGRGGCSRVGPVHHLNSVFPASFVPLNPPLFEIQKSIEYLKAELRPLSLYSRRVSAKERPASAMETPEQAYLPLGQLAPLPRPPLGRDVATWMRMTADCVLTVKLHRLLCPNPSVGVQHNAESLQQRKGLRIPVSLVHMPDSKKVLATKRDSN